jgi:hypothetical protein
MGVDMTDRELEANGKQDSLSALSTFLHRLRAYKQISSASKRDKIPLRAENDQ